MSSATLEELSRVLARPKLERYLSTSARRQFISALFHSATFVEPLEAINACRDPKDNKFLELAATGKAGYIVSGDQDLLVLNPFRGIQIITPADLVELLRGQPDAKDRE